MGMGMTDLLGQFKGRIADVDVANDGQVKEMQNTIELLQDELKKAQCLNPDAAMIEGYERRIRELEAALSGVGHVESPGGLSQLQIAQFEQQLREKDRELAEVKKELTAYKLQACQRDLQVILDRYGMEMATQTKIELKPRSN
jgi:hypothetical protein